MTRESKVKPSKAEASAPKVVQQNPRSALKVTQKPNRLSRERKQSQSLLERRQRKKPNTLVETRMTTPTPIAKKIGIIFPFLASYSFCSILGM